MKKRGETRLDVKEHKEIIEEPIDFHLNQALTHLEMAINLSLSAMLENEGVKKKVGQQWEGFLSKFFGYVREKGKKSKINLLGLISFPKFR